MHHHRVVDNQRPEPAEIRFFPEYLRAAGYRTAFLGKWHMGHDSDPVPSFENLFRRYAEAVHSTDENVGRVLKQIEDAGLRDSTLVVCMGGNGFELGEHGFYDKRDAFETSIRVPLLAWAPGLIKPGTVVTQRVQNIDVAPTLLETAGVLPPAGVPPIKAAVVRGAGTIRRSANAAPAARRGSAG
jgi:arylsulfatase A-like enzyme